MTVKRMSGSFLFFDILCAVQRSQNAVFIKASITDVSDEHQLRVWILCDSRTYYGGDFSGGNIAQIQSAVTGWQGESVVTAVEGNKEPIDSAGGDQLLSGIGNGLILIAVKNNLFGIRETEFGKGHFVEP